MTSAIKFYAKAVGFFAYIGGIYVIKYFFNFHYGNVSRLHM